SATQSLLGKSQSSEASLSIGGLRRPGIPAPPSAAFTVAFTDGRTVGNLLRGRAPVFEEATCVCAPRGCAGVPDFANWFAFALIAARQTLATTTTAPTEAGHNSAPSRLDLMCLMGFSNTA